MMKVESITYSELRSSPGYNNRKAEATIVLEEGDTAEAAIARAKEIVAQALAEPEHHARWDTDWDLVCDEDEEDDDEKEGFVSLADECERAAAEDRDSACGGETKITFECALCGCLFDSPIELLAHCDEMHSGQNDVHLLFGSG